jgi:ATP-binding cassette subfamily B protein
MHRGTITGFATPARLLETNEIYREVYETQVRGGGDFDSAK